MSDLSGTLDVEGTSWKLLHASQVADVFVWGPTVDHQIARRNASLSVMGSENGSAYLCILGDARDDVLLLDLYRLKTCVQFGRPAPTVAAYQSDHAGVCIFFRDTSSVDILRQAAEEAVCSVNQAAPSPAHLQMLGLLVEEDITCAYQRSFVSSEAAWPIRVLEPIFDAGVKDTRPKGAVVPTEPSKTLVMSCSSPSSDIDSDWTSEGEWSGSVCSKSDFGSTDSDSVKFYDAVETPQCTWFDLDA